VRRSLSHSSAVTLEYQAPSNLEVAFGIAGGCNVPEGIITGVVVVGRQARMVEEVGCIQS